MTASVLSLVACRRSAESMPLQSFSVCGHTATVVDGAVAHDWGDRYGNTDGAVYYDVVPTAEMAVPDGHEQVVDGLDDLEVVERQPDNLDGAMFRLDPAGGCSVLVHLVVGEGVGFFYPGATFPWVMSFSECFTCAD